MPQRFYACIRCRVRRQRVRSRYCGPCQRGEPIPHQPRRRSSVRPSVHHEHLHGPPASEVGKAGTRCGTCGTRLEYGVTEGRAWEWCPQHGARWIPREMRASRLHDQRDTLEARLAEEVESEMNLVDEHYKHLQGASRKMQPLDVRVYR